ncbi:MAG TPA: hypothetical protein VK666_08070, partial [Chryseolinea sp.]|nr:hypothetical protein [Chryseolinea sp.]
MKPFQFLATACTAGCLTFLISCNSSADKKTEGDTTTAKADTIAAAPVAPPAAAGPSRIVVIMQKVANYGKWKAAYDGHDTARLASGLHNYVVARGITDTNTVMVALRIDDVEKAKAFGASKNLKDVMKSAGVIGAPTIDYFENVVEDNSTISQTQRVRVKVKVKDWDAWKKNFDSHKQARIDAGLIDRVIGHSIDDDHQVSVVFAITDMEKAKAFMNSKDLKD